ncbi:acetyltransferase (GNAT) family protein [Micromonospora pisi]|uniref:Acetyltransferase (GNAT) family protein n=1 Tax=Micromonospora pisi TaxID=589240 RepID=A0A495JMX6_9ACTN|nr:GNAT family N-acetyltransferase [Micromonospora pisi]RKR90327.1 acetyltransferase (GNAT) family protein [Micromonospora pisi]
MKLVDLTGGPLLEALHREVLATSFPPDQLVSLADLREQIETGLVVVTAAVDDDGRVLGGVVGEWSPASRVMLLSYLAVAADTRGGGVGRLLYTGAVETWPARHRPCLVLAEVESPVGRSGSEAYGDPVARLRFYGRHGARLLELPYFQPALAPGLSRVPDLLLLVLHADTEFQGAGGADTVAGEPLSQFMVEYFEATEGGVPDDPAASALLHAMTSPGGVRLHPVERYREVELSIRG